MPIHLDDVDVTPELAGSRSALIVPCNMCPAVTVAANKDRPFIRFFRHLLRSAPFEQHIKTLQSRLKERGVRTSVFRSDVPHQWFMCMWTAGRRKKLRRQASRHDAVIVLGCDSATETVRDSVRSIDCKVIQGMQVAGVMNAKLAFNFPGDVSFRDCRTIPLSLAVKGEDTSH
jgi:hypothetical protein